MEIFIDAPTRFRSVVHSFTTTENSHIASNNSERLFLLCGLLVFTKQRKIHLRHNFYCP